MHVVGLLVNIAAVTGSQVRNVYWNTTTASFSDKPLIVTVNEGNLPWEYDQVNLICPTLAHGDHSDQAQGEQHVIYSVEKQEFDNCRVSSPRPRIVAVCNRPDTFMYFTITFRSFTPTPGGLEFRPGQEYYFISTANSRDIHRRVGGWCKSHNMKMIVKVAESEFMQNSINDVTTVKPKPIPTPAAFWSKYWNAKVPSHKEQYKYDKTYYQTMEDTYLGHLNSAGINKDSLVSRDADVDIQIVASASHSSASDLLQPMTTLLMSIFFLLSRNHLL